ncbi:hypothetical protein OHS70_38790 (plasmid) [Streptomyces sp. NBC_00390]
MASPSTLGEAELRRMARQLGLPALTRDQGLDLFDAAGRFDRPR